MLRTRCSGAPAFVTTGRARAAGAPLRPGIAACALRQATGPVHALEHGQTGLKTTELPEPAAFSGPVASRGHASRVAGAVAGAAAAGVAEAAARRVTEAAGVTARQEVAGAPHAVRIVRAAWRAVALVGHRAGVRTGVGGARVGFRSGIGPCVGERLGCRGTSSGGVEQERDAEEREAEGQADGGRHDAPTCVRRLRYVLRRHLTATRCGILRRHVAAGLRPRLAAARLAATSPMSLPPRVADDVSGLWVTSLGDVSG